MRRSLPVGVLFALLHSSNPNATWFGLANTGAFGILFGYAYLRSRDLWLPIGLHMGWNFTLPLFGVNLSGLRMNVTGYEMSWTAGALWSGGEYGPEASILTSAVVLRAVRVPVESADSPAVLADRRPARGECPMRACAIAAIAAVVSLLPPSPSGGETDLRGPRRVDARPDGRVRHGQSAAAAVEKGAGVRRCQRHLRQEGVGGHRQGERSGGAHRRLGPDHQGRLWRATASCSQINGGYKGGKKWYQGVQVSANGSAPDADQQQRQQRARAAPRSRSCSISRWSPSRRRRSRRCWRR